MATKPAVTPAVARSMRVAMRYPAKRTFDGMRPTQKVLDILKKEGPMNRDKLWEKCKTVGMPSKTYLKHITRFLHRAEKIIIRPAGPEGTLFEYSINYLTPELKHESRQPSPRWKSALEEDELLEGEEEALAAAEKDEAPTKQSAAQVLKKTASDERTKKAQATAEGAAAAFDKVL